MNPWEQRFGGIERLYGKEAAKRIRGAHVCVVGIGGVGSWTTEALARSGVERITLVDMDEVCVTNINRQVEAIQVEIGQPKVEAMKRRIENINPNCCVEPKASFFTESTAKEILAEPYDVVVDAIDRLQAKCLLLSLTRQMGVKIISTGAAGGRIDTFQIRTADLSRAHHDRLLQKVRKQLRTTHGFPRDHKKPFGIPCVFSPESTQHPAHFKEHCDTDSEKDISDHQGCADGYGSVTHGTGAFGFAAASIAIRMITQSIIECQEGMG